jgi:class 3 adenylate cyclase
LQGKRGEKEGLRSFSKTINAPRRFVFGWCTDFSEDDPKLTGSNFERRILAKTKAKCVFIDLFHGQGGRQNVAVNVVVLKPPNKWHLDLYGDPHNSSLDFKLTELARNRTRLDMTFRESRLDSEAVGFDELWSRYASEIEKDYESTKSSKFSVLSTSPSDPFDKLRQLAEHRSIEGERRLAAIMFTDMIGYTALGQRNESLSLALAEEQKRIIRPILERHRGREVKTMGDAFLVELPSALEAVRSAYEIQRATKEFNVPLPEGRRIHLRVGVHLGDVVETHGDIAGDAVNVASRIEPLADEDGVCLTRQVYDQVRNKLELSFVSLGLKELKNVAEPLEVYRMIMPWEEERGAQPPSELNRDDSKSQ